MSDELPEGWASASLGEGLAIDVQPGFACGKNNRDAKGIPHLRPMNVSEAGEIDLSDVKFVSKDEVHDDRRKLSPGDVLFNNTNSPELVGKTAFYNLAELRAFSNHMTRVRCCAEALDPRFCAMVLHAKWMDGYFASICNNHVSQASISRAVLLETPFQVPPLAEQHRIVAKVEALLARVNAARQRLAKAPAILKRLRQAVLAAACSGRLTTAWREEHSDVDPATELLRQIARERPIGNGIAPTTECPEDLVDLPASWACTTLGFLAEPSMRGRPFVTSGSRGWADRVGKAGPYFIRSENINTEHLRLQDAVRVDAPVGQESERTRVRSGDLLLTITGNNVGRTAIVPPDCPAAHVSQHVAIIRLTPLVSVSFLWMWLRSEKHGQGQLRAYFYGFMKPGLNLEQIKGISITLPPIGEQHEIVRRVEALFRLADAIEQRVAAATTRAEKLPQAILAKAFRGELVPTEAELARREGRDYEPASVLLERIRAIRANEEGQGGHARRTRSKK